MRAYLLPAIAACLAPVSVFAEVPELYQTIAERHGVSGEALYKFALGQSKRQTGGQHVPWPWTVHQNGHRYQFPSRIEMFNYIIANRDKALLFGFDNRALMFQDRTTLWAEMEVSSMLERSASKIGKPNVNPVFDVHPALLPPSNFPLNMGQGMSDDIKVLVTQVAGEVGIDEKLLHAVITQESSYKVRALSEKGAMGLMQLMPATARSLGLSEDEYYDPYKNIHGGARYLKQQLQDFGSLKLALAAYNAGPQAVRKYGNTIPPYPETQNYVSRITARYQQMGGVVK